MRRRASTVIVLLALLLAVPAATPGVSAQVPIEHPAIGAWLIEIVPGGRPGPARARDRRPRRKSSPTPALTAPATDRGPRPASGARMRPSCSPSLTRRAGAS